MKSFFPRVCMLIRFLDKVGGTELQLVRLSRRLQTKGVRILIVTEKSKSKWEMESEITSSWGIPIYSFKTLAFVSNYLGPVLFAGRALMKLIQLRKQYDIIHAHFMASTGVAAAIAGKLLRKPVLVKVTGMKDDIGVLCKSWLSNLRLKLLRRVDYNIALTQAMKEKLLEIGLMEEQILVIPNGVDTSFFQGSSKVKIIRRKQLSLPADARIVVCVARLIETKRHDFLLDAWKMVIENESNGLLILLGDGPLRSELLKKISKLHLEERVLLMGEVSNVRDYLQASDVFVLPSISEGMSNALLEAMACGLPVIVTHAKGNQEVITDQKSGLLFSKYNKLDLAQKMLFLLENQDVSRQLGENAVRTIQTSFSFDAITTVYKSIYSSLIDS